MSAGTVKPLAGRRVLVTGIADASSLALPVARALREAGAELVCAGLGPTEHHRDLSPAAERYLCEAAASFAATVREHLGGDVPTLLLDAGLDGSIADTARKLAVEQRPLDGVVHAIALDRTIRGGTAKRLIDVTRTEFLDCLGISAYSLLGLVSALLRRRVLNDGAAIVALSYLGAERVMPHPYRNIGVAKAALERVVRELAVELARPYRIRVNAVRFSPWAKSRAGGAIPGLDATAESASSRAPLGNADPRSLAREVTHLLHPDLAVTGEIRHVDGGYHVLG